MMVPVRTVQVGMRVRMEMMRVGPVRVRVGVDVARVA